MKEKKNEQNDEKKISISILISPEMVKIDYVLNGSELSDHFYTLERIISSMKLGNIYKFFFNRRAAK